MARKERLVMAFGSFDIIHPGHIKYFKQARKLGDRLLVIVARDESIRALKGMAPAMPEAGRLAIVRSLKCVDEAELGNRLSSESDRYLILQKYRPDVIALGYDQKVNLAEMKKELRRLGVKAKVVRIKNGFHTKVFKSSIIKSRF